MSNDSTTTPPRATLGKSTGPSLVNNSASIEDARDVAEYLVYKATGEAEHLCDGLIEAIDEMFPYLRETTERAERVTFGARAAVMQIRRIVLACNSLLGEPDLPLGQLAGGLCGGNHTLGQTLLEEAIDRVGNFHAMDAAAAAAAGVTPSEQAAAREVFMAGLQLGVDMAMAAEVHQNTDNCDIHIGNRLGRPFMNVARPFVDRLLEAPELAEGFAAVLSHGLSVNGNGTAQECSGLKFQDVHGPWDGLFPDGKVADEAVHAAYMQAQGPAPKKAQRASRATAPAAA